MNVKQKAKAFEGNVSDDNDNHAKPSSGPVPPPRKCKKNETLRQPRDSSPSTDTCRKENIPEITQTKPANSTSLPSPQRNDTEQKKRKPKPPPPPRGSSLGRKTVTPANLQSVPGGKKPRPPVPPKPKNYVPKKLSSTSNVAFKDKTQPNVQSTKERLDSAPIISESGRADDHGSQFFVNLDKGNYTKAVDFKNLDSENSSQFFVPLDQQAQNEKSMRTQDVPSERLVASHPVSTSKGDEVILNSLENVKEDNVDVCENGVASPRSRTIFYDNIILSENKNSGKDSPDLLEGLEIEVDALSEDDDEDFARTGLEQDTENLPLSDTVDVSKATAKDHLDVVKEQSFGELKPGDSAGDSKEKVKVVFNLVLEEECSVTMINDSLEGQKPVDITHETTNFAQTEEGSKPSEGIVAERLHQDEENVPEGDVEDPVDVDFVSEKLSEDTQQSGAEDLVPVEKFCKSTVQHIVESEVDLQLELHGTELQNHEPENEEVITGTSKDLVQSDAQGKREIIMAEPVKEGAFISVTDRAISEGAVEITENTNNELPSNEEVVMDAKEEFESSGLVSGSETVTQPDFEGQTQESMDESEVLHEDSVVQKESKDEISSEGESIVVAVGINDDETSRECLLVEKFNVSTSQMEHIDKTANLDSITNSEAPEEFDSKKAPSTSEAKEALLETLAESSVDDFCGSGKGLEGNEIPVTHIETLDNREEPESQDSKHESETKPQSPEPVRPDRPNRKARQGKNVYENIKFVTNQEEKQQAEGKKNDSLTRRAHSFSKYEAAVHVQVRPVRRTSNDDAIYSVPSKVIPIMRYEDDNSEYSVPSIHATSTRQVIENEYSVPRPIVVQACAVMDKWKADEDGEIYAVPGLPTAVPVTEHSEKEVSAIPQESDNIYVVPAQQKMASTVTTKVAVPPPKPPRQSLVLDQEKKERADVQRGGSQESPKPVPRERGAGSEVSSDVKEEKSSPSPVPRKGSKTEASESATQRASPSPVPRRGSKMEASESESKEQRASPSPVPRKGTKTEALESDAKEQRASPSPVPRKACKTAQTTESSESVSPQGGDSPVPVQRSHASALQSSHEVASSPPAITLSCSEVSVEDSMEDKTTPKHKKAPPPRPPPPDRISFVGSEGTMPPLSPGLGNDLESDSDSDVGEEETVKGPPKSKTYYIVHEILSTERSFVDALKLVFEECYGTIKSANVVADSTLGDIFRDLENIYLLDSRFLQELEERMVTWDEHERIGDIIKKYGHFLKVYKCCKLMETSASCLNCQPKNRKECLSCRRCTRVILGLEAWENKTTEITEMYTQYVNGYDKAMAVFRDTMKENPEFAKLVTQFQASERCHGMILSSYTLKPVQRIPSYRLLLIDYLKHLPKDSDEFKDTETTLKIVSEVATHINESMKKMDSFEQLLKLQNILVGHPEIVKAGRDYLREGMLMKLCRKDMQERMFFLLTDVLLYTTPIGGNQYKLNKMLPLLGMQVTVPDSPDFVNEFSIISTTRSFTLTASTPEERDDWVEALNKAIEVVTKRKITFVSKTRDPSGLLEQEADGVKLGEKAPVWIPDARVTMCMSCTSPFTLTNRRHHCRACGNVVCGSCSDSTAPLAYLDYTQARVCDKCYDLLLREFHTDEIHIDHEEPAKLPPLLEEADNAEKLLRKPTKFEMMRRFKSRKSKRKLQIMHPTHLTEVVANQEGIQMSGYLRFRKGRHGWKKSWFVLKDNVLYSYKASSDVVALETMPVLGYQIENLGKEGDDFVFQLLHKGVPPILFKADHETSAKRWVQELTRATTTM